MGKVFGESLSRTLILSFVLIICRDGRDPKRCGQSGVRRVQLGLPVAFLH